MSMCIADWEKHIETLTDAEIKRYKNAIRTLFNWKTFDKHYHWTAYTDIGLFLQQEQFRRKERNHHE